VRRPGDLDADGVADVLDGLADPDVVLDAATALRTWSALAALAARTSPGAHRVAWPREEPGNPPRQVRVLEGDGTVLVDAEDACVVGDPMHAQRTDLGAFVVASGPVQATALADLFDLPLAADLTEGLVEETGVEETGVEETRGRIADVPAAVRDLVPGVPSRWCEHEELRVDGNEVDWWVDGGSDDRRDALVHAVTLDGLARGLAWAGGAWASRGAIAEVLLDPASLAEVLLDEAFGRPAFSSGPSA
jgi:hypothetical protein